MNQKTQKIALIGMFCAFAYALMLVGRVPVVLFLKYDPKDVMIAIGGFLLGPFASFIISFVVSFIEMLSASETGPIGLVMNVLSSCSFACTAAFIYKKKHTKSGAMLGLFAGCGMMVVVMLLWNYFLVPIYMGYPREAVAAMLLPAFLPFNLLKGGLNMALTLLFYKPVVTALRKAKLALPSTSEQTGNSKGVIVFSLFLFATCTVSVLVMKGIL